jgi:thiol-disulfide isomerase/thioredoxin
MMRKLLLMCLLSLAVFSTAVQAAPTLQPFDADSLARIVQQQKGKPFVLLVWSLECEYCQESLKLLSQEKRKRKDLNVVTLSTDALSDPQATGLMQKRLASLGMTKNAWAFGEAPAEQLRYAIDPKWHGEMPRSYWFNARGEKTVHSGTVTAAMIDRLLAR